MLNHESELRPRAREIGLRIGKFNVGAFNAITDVEGVRVGHTTLIQGEGALEIGVGPIRTGVTAILPHPRNLINEPVEAAHFVFNGAGTTSGLSLIDEFGQVETPILLTNTFSVGAVYDAVTRYLIKHAFDGGRNPRWFNPTVGETYDGGLNDAAGLHINAAHVFAAIENAAGGSVPEGNVGAGTGTTACGFKAGIGTSSRCVQIFDANWTVGALVQSNFGGSLVVCGVPVGEMLASRANPNQPSGSIMIILATDAPLSSRQLHRLAKRATLGLARTGADGGHGSGDYIIAFSTTYRRCLAQGNTSNLANFVNAEGHIDKLFRATADAVEEAILNSLFKAETMTGRDNRTVPELPIDEVLKLLTQHERI